MKQVYTLQDLIHWEESAGGFEKPARLAVVGDPVAHSLSPQMHDAALERCGIDVCYVRLQIAAGDFPEALRLCGGKNFIGLNCTVPHKPAAFEYASETDAVAEKIKAVNTLLNQDGQWIGFNTDGTGFVRAVREAFAVDVRDLRVAIFGAGGGAGRALAVQCALERCERLLLLNRTIEKAENLAKEIREIYRRDRLSGPVDELKVLAPDAPDLAHELEHIDLIVNATSLGLKRTDPSPVQPAALQPHHLVFDTVYGRTRTQLLREASEAGARAIDGLEMLLHQGALAFEVWFERDAPLDVMRQALKKAAGRE